MPFVSEKQRRYLWIHHPEIAKRWSDKYGSRVMGSNKKARRIRARAVELMRKRRKKK